MKKNERVYHSSIFLCGAYYSIIILYSIYNTNLNKKYVNYVRRVVN